MNKNQAILISTFHTPYPSPTPRSPQEYTGLKKGEKNEIIMINNIYTSSTLQQLVLYSEH